MLLVSAAIYSLVVSLATRLLSSFFVVAGGRFQLDLEDFKSIAPPKKEGLLDATEAKIKNLYEGQARMVSELQRLQDLESRCESMQKGACSGRNFSLLFHEFYSSGVMTSNISCRLKQDRSSDQDNGLHRIRVDHQALLLRQVERENRNKDGFFG